MKKHEVELMIIGISMGNEQILNMKIYKDGTLCRSGCGGMPTFAISGMTLEGEKTYWDKLIPLVDEQIVERPVNYQDEKIANPLEYYIAFYGGSTNGETGERANWTKTSGVRFLLDSNTAFRHPLLSFLDGFATHAAEITNVWFFDIVMTAVYDLTPVNLENTFVTVPQTEAEKQEALSRYVNQVMANSASGWDIVKIGDGRKYKTKDGKELTSSVKNNAGQVSINFMEVFGENNLDAATKRMLELIKEEETPPPPSQPEKAAIKDKPTSEKPATKSSKSWWKFWK